MSETKGPVVLIVGTRPEAIKMIPVYMALKRQKIATVLCSTGQHREMIDEIFTLFSLQADFDLKIMIPDQDLFHVTQEVLSKTQSLFKELQPSLVVVQGDTTSAMTAALSAFYLKIPVAHVEAGLRTKNIYAPFPEEVNRHIISVIATYHFAPTKLAVSRLLEEGVSEKSIFCTGNTVVDALQSVLAKIEKKEIAPSQVIAETIKKCLRERKKIVLLTAHRRESFNGGLKQIFTAIKKALEIHPELFIIYPMHPNPYIQEVVFKEKLADVQNMLITSPLSYHDIVFLLSAADGVLTDSGGIQEEAISMQKPVLILRNETDRSEGLQEGLVELVGTDVAKIVAGIDRIVNGQAADKNSRSSIYGDGQASKRIVQVVQKFLKSL